MIEYIFGIVATIMTLSAFGYQLYKIVKTRETKALSYNLMTWVGSAMFLYTLFGLFSLNEPVIYVGNAIGFTINVLLLCQKWRCEHAK